MFGDQMKRPYRPVSAWQTVVFVLFILCGGNFNAAADQATADALIANGFPLTSEAEAQLAAASPEELSQVLANIIDQAIRANPEAAPAIVSSAVLALPDSAADIVVVAVAAAPEQAAAITQSAVEANPAEATSITQAAVSAAPEAAAEITQAATEAAPEAAEAISAAAAESVAESEAETGGEDGAEPELVINIDDPSIREEITEPISDVNTSANEIAQAATQEEIAEEDLPEEQVTEAVVPDATDADDTVPSPN